MALLGFGASLFRKGARSYVRVERLLLMETVPSGEVPARLIESETKETPVVIIFPEDYSGGDYGEFVLEFQIKEEV